MTLMYYLLNVLQRLVTNFWQRTAAHHYYVKLCVKTNVKCPPSIIALLLLMRAPHGSAATVLPLPATSKDRIFWSEVSRAEAQGDTLQSAPASASAATQEDIDSDAFWTQFDCNVMKHLVLPAVKAGVITSAPRAQYDNPPWWTDGIKPMLEDERIYKMHWKGGKKRAKHSWHYI